MMSVKKSKKIIFEGKKKCWEIVKEGMGSILNLLWYPSVSRVELRVIPEKSSLPQFGRNFALFEICLFCQISGFSLSLPRKKKGREG
jgi:hypothetical protein